MHQCQTIKEMEILRVDPGKGYVALSPFRLTNTLSKVGKF